LLGDYFASEQSPVPKGARLGTAQASTEPLEDQETNVLSDVARGGVAGVRLGAEGLAGRFGDFNQMRGDMAAYAADKVFGASPETQEWISEKVRRMKIPLLPDMSMAPTSDELHQATTSRIGESYQPRTTWGDYSGSIGEMASNLVGGGGKLIPRVLKDVVLPGLASETAGQLVEGTFLEPYVRGAAEMLTPLASSGIRRTMMPGRGSPGPNVVVNSVNKVGSLAGGRETLATTRSAAAKKGSRVRPSRSHLPTEATAPAKKGDRRPARNIAYGTHEATPGKETRDLPAVSGGSEKVRDVFASDRAAWWMDPDTGRDVWHSTLGRDAHPSVSTTGIYLGEFNPGMTARSLVVPTGPRGYKVLTENSAERARLNAAESGRALFGGQEAGAWSVLIPDPRLDHANAYASKLPADMQGREGLETLTGRVADRVKDSGWGMDQIVHYGGSDAVLTRFPSETSITPEIWRDVAAQMSKLGIEVTPVRLESGYVPYTKAQGFGGDNPRPGWELPDGTDTLTMDFLSRLTPRMERALDASPALRQSILDKYNYGIEQAARLKSPVRKDLQNVRRAFAQGWPEMGLPRGIAGIKLGLGKGLFPAIAVAPLLPYLTDADDQSSEGGGL
jgi:hypothetical protein